MLRQLNILIIGLGITLNTLNCKPAAITPAPDPSSFISARDNNLALGNPSGASSTNANNYLLDKGVYIFSYYPG